MENKTAYAVINHDDDVVDVLSTFDSALAVACDSGAYSIETLKGYDGIKGRVVETFYMDNNENPFTEKIAALFLLFVGIISIFINYDITFAILAVPVALYLLFTN